MKIRDRLIKGTIYNFIAVVFNQGSTLLVNIIVARILLKNVFGEYAIVQSTLLTAATLSQLATGYTASKYIAEYRTTDPEKAGRIMGLCSIVSAVMALIGTTILIIIAPWLAKGMLNAPHLSHYIIIGSGFLFFSAINGYQTGVLSGLEAFNGLAKAGVTSGLGNILIITICTNMAGFEGSILGLSLSALFRCITHYIELQIHTKKNKIKPIYHNSLRLEKDIILKFALPAAIAGYYTMPMIWIANSFLVRQPGGYGEMALYCAANNLRVLILFLPNVLNSVGLSVLNNEKYKSKSAFNRVLFYNVINMVFVSMIGSFIVGVWGKHFLLFFGKDFINGYSILWILVLASIFESISIALYQYIQCFSLIWSSFFTVTIPRDTIYVISAYYMVTNNGAVGLATAYMITTILGTVIYLNLVVINERRFVNK